MWTFKHFVPKFSKIFHSPHFNPPYPQALIVATPLVWYKDKYGPLLCSPHLDTDAAAYLWQATYYLSFI